MQGIFVRGTVWELGIENTEQINVETHNLLCYSYWCWLYTTRTSLRYVLHIYVIYVLLRWTIVSFLTEDRKRQGWPLPEGHCQKPRIFTRGVGTCHHTTELIWHDLKSQTLQKPLIRFNKKYRDYGSRHCNNNQKHKASDTILMFLKMDYLMDKILTFHTSYQNLNMWDSLEFFFKYEW